MLKKIINSNDNIDRLITKNIDSILSDQCQKEIMSLTIDNKVSRLPAQINPKTGEILTIGDSNFDQRLITEKKASLMSIEIHFDLKSISCDFSISDYKTQNPEAEKVLQNTVKLLGDAFNKKFRPPGI